jgi:oligopeptide/dipeptide ABC transporter ATP-binding protein
MLLSLRKVKKYFPIQRGVFGKATAYLKAVDDVSLDLEEGQIIGVVGESGCGKSTLGRCAVGLFEPSLGKVFWENADLDEMQTGQRRKIQRFFQMVFQNPFASLNPRQKVLEILSEPLEVHGILQLAQISGYVDELLRKVGLFPGDLSKYPHEFSGGQRQRIALARALACQPRLLVLDEPLSSLDVSVQSSILNLLVRLNHEKNISYLFISHDLQVVGYLSRRVLVMYLGKVVEEGDTTLVLKKPRHPYTQVLLEASEGGKTKIEGEPPSQVHIPSGCAFAPRCPFVENRCRVEKQPLLEIERNWKAACWKWDKN